MLLIGLTLISLFNIDTLNSLVVLQDTVCESSGLSIWAVYVKSSPRSIIGPHLFNTVVVSLKLTHLPNKIVKYVNDCIFVIPVIRGSQTDLSDEHQCIVARCQSVSPSIFSRVNFDHREWPSHPPQLPSILSSDHLSLYLWPQDYFYLHLQNEIFRLCRKHSNNGSSASYSKITYFLSSLEKISLHPQVPEIRHTDEWN